MKINSREIKQFFYSQYFSDGLRMAAGILFPSLFFNFFGQFNTGLTMSLGAVCICTIDTPGPLSHKHFHTRAGDHGIFFPFLYVHRVWHKGRIRRHFGLAGNDIYD